MSSNKEPWQEHKRPEDADKVLIAGCGRLGRAVGLQLVADDNQVFGLRRNPVDLPAEITPVEADLLDKDRLGNKLPSNLSLIYYIVTPARFDDEGYRLAFVEGLSNICSALSEADQAPRRLIFVSSTGVYGQQDGEWIDETSPTEPTRFSGQRLLEAERFLAEQPWPVAIARLGGIYGPDRDMFINKVRAGEACRPDGHTNRIHAEDAVGMLVHLGRQSTSAGVYLGVDDEPSTQCQVMDFIAARLGLPRPPRNDSAAQNSQGSRGVGSKRGDNSKLQQSGYRFQYPTFREGYRALIEGA